jgi:serine protease AprX
MRFRLFFFFILFIFQQATAQEYKFLIRFRDKKNNGYRLSDPSAFLSAKSIARRQKQHILIDSTDLPLSSVYMDSLGSLPSLQIVSRSKWFNLVMISVQDSSLLSRVLQFPFVISSEPVNNRRLKKIPDQVSINQVNSAAGGLVTEEKNSVSGNISDADYGVALNQVHIHHGEYLHNQGFQGKGMTVAILDNGFKNYLSNVAFDSLRLNQRILGSYDFVHQKTSVNEESSHGAHCFSIIAADIPGTMIGTAPMASYWLFKTEDDLSESPVEEQNWVAAAEFADSVGVDLITTSLGYGYFDNSKYDIGYPERNGHTSLVTIAANMAVSKGMIVTASAGNSGNDDADSKYVLCPADGDKVYTVGASDYLGNIAGFSSWGPNGSGQVKPDGVSIGAGTSFIGTDGNTYSGNGTSFSNPNLAGLIICLWQAFPEFGTQEILTAVRESSDHYDHPDDRYGFGIPDFEIAYHSLLLKRNAGLNPLTSTDWIHVFPVPFEEKIYLYILPVVSGEASIQLMNVNGKLMRTQTAVMIAGQAQLVEYKIPQPLAKGAYFIRYIDQKQAKTLKILKK